MRKGNGYYAYIRILFLAQEILGRDFYTFPNTGKDDDFSYAMSFCRFERDA